MKTNLVEKALALTALTQSTYEIAMAAVPDGPQRDACLCWLMKHRRNDQLWGEPSSWYDTYVSSYAAAAAFYAANCVELAESLVARLPSIAVQSQSDYEDTLTFGGIIGALDRLLTRRFGAMPPDHPPVVRGYIQVEAKKWAKLSTWAGFHDRFSSTAGFVGEFVYGDPGIDLAKFIACFSTADGSISGSPSASVFTLLAAEEASICTPELRAYVQTLNPAVRTVGVLNSIDYFALSWTLMYRNIIDCAPLPDLAALRNLRQSLFQSHTYHLICAGGSASEQFPYPPDMDTTAGAIAGLRISPQLSADMIQCVEPMFFKQSYYHTFQLERNPSVSTNLHILSIWPDNPNAPTILDWLSREMDQGNGVLTCKWHSSPFYAMSELVRILATWNHPTAAQLVQRAVPFFMDSQRLDGGWGRVHSTQEETGYAVIALSALRNAGLLTDQALWPLLECAETYLEDASLRFDKLWIGKSLYCVRPVAFMLREVARFQIAQMKVGTYMLKA